MDIRYTSPVSLLLATLVLGQSPPVFHWALDETTGTIAYDLTNTSDGQLQDGAQWAPSGGHHQGACRFDGVNDRIILGACDLTTGGGAISLSVWVKPDFVTGMERTILAKTVGPQPQDHIWSVSFVNATALRFRLRTGGQTTELSTPGSSIFSGVWYHVVASYDGSSMRVFLNGSLMAENSIAGSIGFHPQAPASLGAQSTGARPFSGWIDDVRIYDRGLTASEVVQILLEQELTTGVEVPAPHVQPDGRLLLPLGPWTELRIMDLAGRSLVTQQISGITTSTAPNSLPTGLYLVSLLGAGQRKTWRMLWP